MNGTQPRGFSLGQPPPFCSQNKTLWEVAAERRSLTALGLMIDGGPVAGGPIPPQVQVVSVSTAERVLPGGCLPSALPSHFCFHPSGITLLIAAR